MFRMIERIVDAQFDVLDRLSVWLRWRWGRSHYELVGPMLMVMLGVGAMKWGSMTLFDWAGMAVWVLCSTHIAICSLDKAKRHNRPEEVDEYGWSAYPLMFVLTWITGVCFVLDVFLVVIVAQWWQPIGTVAMYLAFALDLLPGRKVDHEPPEKLSPAAAPF